MDPSRNARCSGEACHEAPGASMLLSPLGVGARCLKRVFISSARRRQGLKAVVMTTASTAIPGWTVFQMPSIPWVAEARPIGLVRLRSSGSGKACCLAELRRRGPCPWRSAGSDARRGATGKHPARNDGTCAPGIAASARPLTTHTVHQKGAAGGGRERRG